MLMRSLAVLCCLLWSLAVPARAMDTATLLVRVTDGEGRPVAGATVRVTPEHEADSPEPEIRKETSPEGIARIPHLRPDWDFWVLVERQGFATELQRVSPEDVRETRVVLRPGSVRKGRVLDEQGRPVPEADVELAGEPFELDWEVPPFLQSLVRPRTRTDAAGRFRFRDLPDADYELIIRHSRHATLVADRRIKGSAKGSLGTFVLRQGVSLRGVVTDADGQPVGGARIWVQSYLETEMAETPPLELAATSAANGTFSIPHSLPGREMSLRVCASGFSETLTGTDSPEKPLRILLQPGASLSGRVLGPDGWPVAGAMVHTTRIAEIDECFPLEPICDEPVITDAEGWFHFTGLWPARYMVTARAPGMVDAEGSVEIGEEPRLHLREGFTVAGRALDPNGRPLPGAEVWIQEKSQARVTTLEDGSFRIEGVATGRNVLRAKALGSDGYRFASQTIDVPDSEIWIDLVLLPARQ